MDLSLFVTIGLIFLVTSAVGYVRSRISDRCLRSFHRFNVTLLRTDGKRAWGRMALSAGGMELAFPEREHAQPGVKTTYLLYAGEYPVIQAILRYADRLTADERRARDADIARSFRPGPLRRFGRAVRNFVGSATDSLRDVLALVLGRVQKLQDRFVAAEGTDTLTKLGGTMLADVSSIHDPLLERHVGHRVVVEAVEGNEIHEHVGIFKEYSAAFLHVLDVQYPHAWTLEVGPDEGLEEERVLVAREGTALKVSNHGQRPVLIVGLEAGGTDRAVDALVEAGGAVSLPLDAEAGRVGVRLQTVRDVDMILPRARAAVRHRASELPPTAEPESTWDFVFDLGTLIRRRGDADADETRLREALEKNPDDAAAAARLGGLLLKKQDYTAAGRWLRAAYNGRAALPDDGRRVRMQLRELARRLAALGGRHVGGPQGRIGEEPPPRSPPG
jgi:hypothetical protein